MDEPRLLGIIARGMKNKNDTREKRGINTNSESARLSNKYSYMLALNVQLSIVFFTVRYLFIQKEGTTIRALQGSRGYKKMFWGTQVWRRTYVEPLEHPS